MKIDEKLDLAEDLMDEIADNDESGLVDKMTYQIIYARSWGSYAVKRAIVKEARELYNQIKKENTK